MSSDRKLDSEAVRAAKEFLLGPSGEPGHNRGRRGVQRRGGQARAPESPVPAPPPAPPTEIPIPAQRPWLELAAPDIRRTDSGWRARCIHTRGVDARHVSDARYGGYLGSFIAALEARDRFYRERGLPIPWEIEAIVDGERIAPEVVRRKRSVVVRWQDQEHVVTGDDAQEIATEIALDLFVEFLGSLQAEGPVGSEISIR